MFDFCSNLTSLNLSNFNTSSVTSMGAMFDRCSSLISLDLSSFDTSKVQYMNYTFNGCSNLIYLNLSNFNTSNVILMNYMFGECSSLTYLDLSSFDTSKVKNMNFMFYGCSNLTSLNLSNFNTSSVTSMESMFSKCSKLISLNLSYFNTSKVYNMKSMFDGCSNLISLDLSNFNISSVTISLNMFTFSRCYNLANINLINFKLTKNIINNKNYISKYSGLPSNLFICTENEDWPKIFNLSDKQYVNCINNIFNSNINENESIIKCYKKNIESDNPCQMCGNNYLNNSGIINNTYMNCFINDTSDYSSFDSSIIIEKEIEIKNRTELIQNMINNLFQRINISYIDKGEDEKTDDKNISIIITSTKNQKKKKMKA